MEVSRYLRKDRPTKANYYPIRLKVTFGKELYLSTGERCKVEHWDKDAQKMHGKAPFAAQINAKLSTWENILHDINREFERRQELLTPAKLKAAFEERIKPIPEPEPAPVPNPEAGEELSPFFKLFDAWVDQLENKVQDLSGRKTAPGTIRGNRATIARFRKFEEHRGEPVTFETLDKQFYQEFQSYMLELLKQKPNNFGKHIKKLKSFLKWCEEELDEDLRINRKYSTFKAPSTYVGVDALTAREVHALYNLDFTSAEVNELVAREFPKSTYKRSQKAVPHAREMEIARDIFLMMCYTGLRVSDIGKLRPQDIKGDVIVIAATKTLNTCYIPVYDDTVFKPNEVLAKYDGLQETALPVLPDPVLNRHLKHIATLTGIKRLNLTTKIGRKTFVTLKIYQGVETRLIMQATGHKTEAAFNAYVGTDVNELVLAFRRQSAKNDARAVSTVGTKLGTTLGITG